VKKVNELNTDWVDLSDPIGSLRKRLERDVEQGYCNFVQAILPRASCPVLGIRTKAWRKVVDEALAFDGAALLDAIFSPKQDKRRRKRPLELEFCEERLVVGETIGKVKVEFDRRVDWIDAFLPLIDSWLICDTFCQAIKPKPDEKIELWSYLDVCLASDEPYTIRFALVMLLKRYVDQYRVEEIFDRLENFARRKIDVRCVNVGAAWLLTETFIKFPDLTWRYLQDNSLDDFTFNQALQKICDSLRVDDETKEEIRMMRRKKR